MVTLVSGILAKRYLQKLPYMIVAMVDRLEARLESNPRDHEGWIRLARSRLVLGDRQAARLALPWWAVRADTASIGRFVRALERRTASMTAPTST